jgi:hypothetical protein
LGSILLRVTMEFSLTSSINRVLIIQRALRRQNLKRLFTIITIIWIAEPFSSSSILLRVLIKFSFTSLFNRILIIERVPWGQV